MSWVGTQTGGQQRGSTAGEPEEDQSKRDDGVGGEGTVALLTEMRPKSGQDQWLP